MSPAKTSIELAPSSVAEPGDERVRAERIALVDQHRLGAEALVDPVGEQQVRGHVVVDQADAEDADVAGGDERDRGEQRRPARPRPGRRGRTSRRLGASTRASAEQQRRRARASAPSTIAIAVPRPPRPATIPATDEQQGEADRAREPASARGRRRASSAAWPTASEAATISAAEAIAASNVGYAAKLTRRRRAPGRGRARRAARRPGPRWSPRPCAGCRRRPRG